MIGSWLGERFGLGPRRLKVLLACGAAAGMAATYNVPIGGALWAMEVILGNFALEIFGPIVVASVIATLLARFALGDVPLYAATQYELQNGWELIPYLGLGVIGAFTAVAFVFGVRGGKAMFSRLPLPEWLKPTLGLAMVGVMAIRFPQVIGNGFEGITQALRGHLALRMLLLLPVAKIVASAITSGSGGAGGTFTPSLFVGAMVGGSYGVLVHSVWPFAVTSTVAPIAERFDVRPSRRMSIHCVDDGSSFRRRAGRLFIVMTSMSMSPSLSMSPNAAPRLDRGVVTPGPLRSETSSKVPPSPRFRNTMIGLLCGYSGKCASISG